MRSRAMAGFAVGWIAATFLKKRRSSPHQPRVIEALSGATATVYSPIGQDEISTVRFRAICPWPALSSASAPLAATTRAATPATTRLTTTESAGRRDEFDTSRSDA